MIFGTQHNQETILYAPVNSPIMIINIGSQILKVTAAKQAA